ncbi:hypothetical protein DMUE_6353, partial [Dictyocoela muelleri]
DLSDIYPLNRVFTWWAFSLCRLSLNDEEKSSKSRTVFTIECELGKDIQHHSYYPNEDQILLIASSQFQVLSSIQINPNEYRIHLKEIPSNNSFFTMNKNVSPLSIVLSPNLLRDLSSTNIPSRSKVESIKKYIDRTLKLQNKIGNSPLYSSIDLSNQTLDDQDVSLIIQHAIIKKQCSILRLENNFLTSQSTTILANVLKRNETLI